MYEKTEAFEILTKNFEMDEQEAEETLSRFVSEAEDCLYDIEAIEDLWALYTGLEPDYMIEVLT